LLKPLAPPRRLFLISDTKVAGLYGPEVQKALKDSGFEPVLFTTPPGERAKRWAVVQRLARELLRLGGHRGSLLLALGGGVVGDLTGFLASIFMRGLPYIQVPTTLLAMVDASLGGKTAINLPEGKNLLGTFHQPRLVAIDPEFLRTLPPQERLNGLAEVLKAGFIGDPDLLLMLPAARGRRFRDPEAWSEIIYRAAALKARVVAQDEREAGLRRILNFGHTLGHALEQASGFRLPHGRAVALGMDAALVLSEKLAGLPREETERGRRLLRDLGLTLRPPSLDPQAILAALPWDKKRREEKLVFVLLHHLGEPVIQEGVPLGPVAAALQEVMRL
jgi:3-dehydroquinate synthase